MMSCDATRMYLDIILLKFVYGKTPHTVSRMQLISTLLINCKKKAELENSGVLDTRMTVNGYGIRNINFSNEHKHLYISIVLLQFIFRFMYVHRCPNRSPFMNAQVPVE